MTWLKAEIRAIQLSAQAASAGIAWQDANRLEAIVQDHWTSWDLHSTLAQPWAIRMGSLACALPNVIEARKRGKAPMKRPASIEVD